jgi:hypothetical protein
VVNRSAGALRLQSNFYRNRDGSAVGPIGDPQEVSNVQSIDRIVAGELKDPQTQATLLRVFPRTVE